MYSFPRVPNALVNHARGCELRAFATSTQLHPLRLPSTAPCAMQLPTELFVAITPEENKTSYTPNTIDPTPHGNTTHPASRRPYSHQKLGQKTSATTYIQIRTSPELQSVRHHYPSCCRPYELSDLAWCASSSRMRTNTSYRLATGAHSSSASGDEGETLSPSAVRQSTFA